MSPAEADRNEVWQLASTLGLHHADLEVTVGSPRLRVVGADERQPVDPVQAAYEAHLRGEQNPVVMDLGSLQAQLAEFGRR